MTNRTALGVLGAGVLIGALGVGFLVAAGVTECGCTPAERTAVAGAADKAEGPLDTGCRVVETFANDAWIDFVCDSLEGADKLLEKLPQAKVTTQATILAPDGGASKVIVSVRCPAQPRDGGGGA